jgi:hypothetical protein
MTFMTGEAYSYPVLIGPVVGPGVVAYGATSVPLVSGVGLGYGQGRQAPVVRVVTVLHRNVDVLEALEALTGQSFGYDPAAWRRWWTEVRAAEEPVKRVRQP